MKRFPTYQMMIGHLNSMAFKTEAVLFGNTNWWTFGPIVCRKFINHASSLELIFHHTIEDYYSNKEHPYFDISSIWTLIRALHETHGVFCHLFIPCDNIEENILRFRLWELDSLQSILEFQRDLVENEISDTLQQLFKNEITCLDAIKKSSLFNKLSERSQEMLLKKPNWRFIFPNVNTRLSYDKLILNTGLSLSHFKDMYEYTSMHVHPAYGGVRQNADLTKENMHDLLYVAIMQSCYVTALLMRDMKARYIEAAQHYDSMDAKHRQIIESFIAMSSS